MRRRFSAAALGILLGSAWACGSVPTTSPSGLPSPPKHDRSSTQPESPISPAARVVELARSLLRAPYRYAGGDPRGFDCSGLTAYVFERVGFSLPRTARGQAVVGRWVAPDELASGDLVFFGDDRANPNHVGVVVSEPGEELTMIHSSSSLGVIETRVLRSSYWLSRLRFGRRVLEGD